MQNPIKMITLVIIFIAFCIEISTPPETLKTRTGLIQMIRMDKYISQQRIKIYCLLFISGFSRLHPEDKTFLCKNVTFMNTLLLAGHHQYNPTEKSFQEFWNWPINPQNPFYPFKQSLLQMGERIHGANMDVYEVSALAALLFLATGIFSYSL